MYRNLGNTWKFEFENFLSRFDSFEKDPSDPSYSVHEFINPESQVGISSKGWTQGFHLLKAQAHIYLLLNGDESDQDSSMSQ